ncbi:MAG: hypothetical protein J2P55_00045 [Rhizobiales bacterium]|nr:hypothetical protein [Hyphomicrobiales bacterium]
MCSEDHIRLIVNATPNGNAETFGLLVRENVRSLEERYPGRDFLKDWQNDAKTYRYKKETPPGIIARAFIENADTIAAKNTLRKAKGEICLTAHIPAVVHTQVVKACDCFDYQACETTDYHATPAAAFVASVRNMAMEAGGKSDGALYDQLLWGL